MGKEQGFQIKRCQINIVTGLVTIFSVILAVGRNCCGIEITDEAFYVSEAVSILRGNAPVVFTMSDKPFFPVLLMECIRLYQLLIPDLEGIFLFSRTVFLVFRLCISAVIYIVLRKEFNRQYLIFALCVLFTIWGNSIPNLSYNTISCWLIILAGAITYISLTTQNTGKSRIFSGITGVLISLAVLAHVGQALNAVWFGIMYLLFGKAQKRRINFMIYAYSGAGAAFCVLFLLLLQYGRDKLIFGLETAFHYINRPAQQGIEGNIKYTLDNIGWVLIIFGVVFSVTFFYRMARIKFKKIPSVNFEDATLAAVFLCMLRLLFRYNDPATNLLKVGAVGGVFLLAVGGMAVADKDRKAGQIITAFMTFPVIYVIICGFGMDTMAYKRFWMFGFIFFGGVLLFERYFRHGSIPRKALCCLTFVFVFIAIASSEWSYLYRENSLWELDTKVTEGVYKGIYTTAQKADDTQALEKYIKEITSKEDRVLFLDNVPVGYMMSEAVPWTPSTWDLTAYTYGFNNPDILYRYFENKGAAPTKIIYVDYGRDEKMSIDDEKHLFNDFINENYVFSESRFIGDTYEVRVYEQ